MREGRSRTDEAAAAELLAAGSAVRRLVAAGREGRWGRELTMVVRWWFRCWGCDWFRFFYFVKFFLHEEEEENTRVCGLSPEDEEIHDFKLKIRLFFEMTKLLPRPQLPKFWVGF